ncbi:Uncharacterised protein [Mycobacterium tuberculosis]|nr:Uncharacterised protein [Mycobacterium tuberculosis]
MLANNTSIFPSRSACGPGVSTVTSETVIPAGAQASAMVPMVAANRALGLP